MKIKSSGRLVDEQAEQMQLTAREQEVLAWVAQGKTNREIAQLLWVAPSTVRKHLENVYAKLGVGTRTGAVARFFGTACLVLSLIVTLAGCGGSTLTEPLGPGHEQLQAGVQTLDLAARVHPAAANSLAHLPRIELTVPRGWFNFDGWAMHKDAQPSSVFVTFWDVDRVYPVPCRWQYRPMVDPGRGVEGLASALAEQPLRQATAPTDVVLAGFRGKYLEWSVPTDVDFNDCDEGAFESWTARGWSSDRYQQAPGQVDRLWILNVDGERLVVDASYLPEATAADRAELERVVSSIRFRG